MKGYIINKDVLKCFDCGSKQIKLTNNFDIVDCTNCGEVNPVYVGFLSTQKQKKKLKRGNNA
jgi:uncharacterized Zn finger protein